MSVSSSVTGRKRKCAPSKLLEMLKKRAHLGRSSSALKRVEEEKNKVNHETTYHPPCRIEIGQHEKKVMKKLEQEFIDNCEVFSRNAKSLMSDYLVQKGYRVKKQFRKNRNNLVFQDPIRLTFMTGGSFRFPLSEWSTLLDLRCKDILEGNCLTDNQIAFQNEGIRLFFELDYRSLYKSISLKEMFDDIQIVRNTVKEYYVSNSSLDLSCWVLTRETIPKMNKEVGVSEFADGIHLIFPNIIVDCEAGKQLCFTANQSIHARYHRDPIDLAPYHAQNANLRPMKAKKLLKCPQCKAVDFYRYQCEVCNHIGNVLIGATYGVSHRVLNDDTIQNVADIVEELGTEKLVRLTCIETCIALSKKTPLTKGFKIPEHYPTYPSGSSISTKYNFDLQKGITVKERHVRNLNRSRRRMIYSSEVEYILRSILNTVDKTWFSSNSTSTSEIQSTPSGNSIYFWLDGPNSTHCKIAKRHHKSNRVWFKISRCSSKDYTGTLPYVHQFCHDEDCKGKSEQFIFKNSMFEVLKKAVCLCLNSSNKPSSDSIPKQPLHSMVSS